MQACFRSVLQGDHLGVKFATAAHQGLLEEAGLLDPAERILGSSPLNTGPRWQALVIDDFFTISELPRSQVPGLSCNTPTLAKKAMDQAQEAYRSHGLLGSSEKDVVNATKAKAAGAEVDASPSTLSRGIALVGAPASKRWALAHLTVEVASLPATSDTLHACILGAWTSAALYRRPVLACLDAAYRLAPSSSLDAHNPKVIPLPRLVAQELLLLSLMGPIMVSDIAARPLEELFATDSSQKRGAIVSARISSRLSLDLWLTADRKGAFARMDSHSCSALARLDALYEPRADMSLDSAIPLSDSGPPERPMAYEFDFIEVFAGAGVISKEMSTRGWRVGPPLDIDVSAAYDVKTETALLWLFFLIDNGRASTVFLSPPCTTFPLLPTLHIAPAGCCGDFIRVSIEPGLAPFSL